LEMNTRLQVEHPVTEEVTGLDLVEQMIRVAAGEKLAFGQDDVKLNGWAIENRVYAEDPYRGFLPSTGRLVRYMPPAEVRDAGGVTRVDDGVTEGSEISMFYDPMIAKLITWAPTREEAAARQVAALDRFRIDGIGHNIDFLSAIVQHPRFLEGRLTTGFIAEEYPEGFAGAPASAELQRKLAAVAAVIDLERQRRASAISGQLNGTVEGTSERVVTIDGERFTLSVERHAGGQIVRGADEPMELVGRWRPGEPLFAARIDDAPLTVGVERKGATWRLTAHGATHKVEVLPPHIAQYRHHMIEKVPPDLSKFLLAPMPGLLTQLHVAPGDKVEAGQPLAVVEAMKMENILRAERAGTVKAANFAAGDSLAVDAAILEFE
ncbi:MAG TPA: biotin/lipoyl-containing protein, partial [Sphingomonas sp.]|nr:biotin/lipoyl-containing protein [Sphingomonas sp.]